MLRNISSMRYYNLMAKDGEIGKCRDFLFDDDQWTIRYMVADTSRWLPGRKVLISPLSLGTPQWPDQLLPVDLTEERIEQSPTYDPKQPVNLGYEARIFDYYGRPVARP